MLPTRRALSVMGIVPLVFLASACAAPLEHEYATTAADPVLSADELKDIYRSEVAQFNEPMPSGQRIPPEPPDSIRSAGQRGSALGAVYFYWLCSWERDYLEAVDAADEARGTSALDQLARWPALDFTQRYVDDPEHAWERDVLRPTRLGDPTGVRADFDGGCKAVLGE